MKRIVLVICLILGAGGLCLGDTTKITIRREPTPDREYYQRNNTGGAEKVKEYRGGGTVKEGFRYEEGKGIIKYNEAQPQDTRRRK